MVGIIAIIISALITNNIVFSQTLGICPFLRVSKKTSSSVIMGLAVTLVVVLSGTVLWVINKYLLVSLKLEYLRIMVFMLVIASIVQALDAALKKLMPSRYSSKGVYLVLIITNCAVLGTALNIISLGFADMLVTAFFTGLGFMLASLLMSGVRERTETANIPQFFKGFPITLVAAAIMALAFMGFESFGFALAAAG